MLVVVDTNVMLSAFARHSPTARLFRPLAGGEVRLAVTAAIILEYEEIAGERGGSPFAAKVMHFDIDRQLIARAGRHNRDAGQGDTVLRAHGFLQVLHRHALGDPAHVGRDGGIGHHPGAELSQVA